jgi:hypothetical protein
MPGQTEHIFVRTGAHPRADLFQLAVRGGGIGGFAVTGIPPRSLRVSEIGDDRFALLCLFHTRVNHLSSWHELLRVGQILVQLSLVPDNVRVLVGIGVVEPRDGSRLTADDASQARAETVLAGLDGMADPTGAK